MKDYSDKSFWLATYGPYTPNPPVQGDLSVDVAIIGGGFTGLSTAYHLRRENAGLRVAVLEAEVIGFGASGRNGGFSMTHLNGKTVADLILERKTDLTDVWFVNRRMILWPPEPLRLVASHAIRGYMRLEDALYERGMLKT